MQLYQKARSAIKIFSKDGWTGLRAAAMRNIGISEPELVDEADIAFRALTRSKRIGTMVDVGAHYGHTAEPFCRAGWRVLAFEPDSQNRAKLAAALCQYPDATIDSRAVSDSQGGEVTLYRSAESSGISGLSAFNHSHVAADKVSMTTLRVALQEYGIKSVEFLKIDTEGFDKFVLDGFPWNEFQPKVILCEFEDHKTKPLGYGFHDLARILIGHKYEVMVSEWSPIVRYGVPHDWVRFQKYPCDLSSPKGWGNLIASNDPVLFDYIELLCSRAGRRFDKRSAKKPVVFPE